MQFFKKRTVHSTTHPETNETTTTKVDIRIKPNTNNQNLMQVANATRQELRGDYIDDQGRIKTKNDLSSSFKDGVETMTVPTLTGTKSISISKFGRKSLLH
jgi:hypothetical protein